MTTPEASPLSTTFSTPEMKQRYQEIVEKYGPWDRVPVGFTLTEKESKQAEDLGVSLPPNPIPITPMGERVLV